MAVQSIELIHTPNYHQIKQNFLQELQLASLKKPSSLSFIKHHLPPNPLIKKGVIQGIVIGGTNYIFSTERIEQDGKRTILDKKTGVLPIFTTKQVFVDFLSEHIDPQAEAIGVNFGFKMEPLYGKDGSLDGIIKAKGTKDHTFSGLTEPLGEIIKDLFSQKYGKKITTVVANDTVCLLLSGHGTEQGSLIAGTGFNMGLLQKNPKSSTLINIEAGGFNKFTLSPVLQKIDSETKNPGEKLFEKIISGKYLARYFNEKIKEMDLPISPITTSQELSELSHTNHTDISGDLARAIIERSAFFVASAIAALYEFSDKPSSSFTIIGEGSLLWNGWHYHENILKQLQKLTIPSHAVEIKHIQNSSINGAFGLLTYHLPR